MENPQSSALPFKINFEGTVDKKLPLKVFVFDRQDKLLESHTIDGDTFHLKTDDKTLQHAQIFIAPITDALELKAQPLPTHLKEMGAYRPVLEFDVRKQLKRVLLPIPEILWRDWYFCVCRVRGQVVKPLFIPFPFGRGFNINMPVCHARVHVCRLESRFHLLKDADIFKLRDDLLAFKPQTVIPRPGDPAPFLTHSAMKMATETSVGLMEKSGNTPLSISLQNQLQTNSVGSLRQILTNNLQEIQYYPFFCWFYNCVELAVAETDADGRFDVRVWERCFNPNHNYYVWVEYLIDGVWQAVYKPSYCLGAFWNYACGTELTISVTDSRVPLGCRPMQTGSFFEVVSIGSGAFVSHIHQKEWVGGIETVADKTGLIDMGYGDGNTNNNQYLSPFGGNLVIKVNTGMGFPSANATHYKCLYKKTSDPDVPASWKSVNNGSYTRPYTEEVQVTPTNVQAFGQAYELNEKGTDFYKLTHENVEDDLGAPTAPILNREWASDTYDLATLNTGTLGLENTHYDIRIEIYKKNTATNTYSLTTVAKNVFKVPNSSNPLATMDAPDSFLKTTTQGGVTSHVFQMTIRVDNNSCTAAIDDARVLVNTIVRTSDTACGMLNYGDVKDVPLTVGFHAQHVNNFAWFSFGIYKGNSGAVLGVSGQLTDTPLHFQNSDNDGGVHRHHFESTDLSAATFLGACSGAAFAENLYVAALATDGSVRLSNYDAAKTAAFAMIP